MFPDVRVNRKSCSISIYGFSKQFPCKLSESILEIATLANSYVLAAKDRWKALDPLKKTLGSEKTSCFFQSETLPKAGLDRKPCELGFACSFFNDVQCS